MELIIVGTPHRLHYQEERSILKIQILFILPYVSPTGRTDDQRREAFEEVNLPLDGNHPSIHHITTLEPVLTILPLNAHLKNHIIVIREIQVPFLPDMH